MQRNLRSLIVIPVLFALAACGTTPNELSTLPAPTVAGQYIVALADGGAERLASDDFAASVSRLGSELGISAVTPLAIANAFVASGLDASDVARLEADPRIAYVEADQVISVNAASWGLDRIDQRDLPLDASFSAARSGEGVTAYVIDTGIRRDHVEFSGRLTSGYSVINDGFGSDDCNGHGTHVAGTIGGSSFGVAPGVTLVSVRVLGCDGSGTVSGAIQGLDWVASNASGPAVANLSLGSGPSASFDAAVANLSSAGVTVIVAAGNDNRDACEVSPARAPSAFTVGATTRSDARSSFSNYGSCVDVFAPGSAIVSAYATSATASVSMSGTSMAAPHVAGAAAQYLQGAPTATPAQVRDAISANATVNVLSALGSGSPNRLLYVNHGVCVDCPSLSGHFDGPRQSHVFNATRSSDGLFEARLESGTDGADFDLYLERFDGVSWVSVAASRRSGDVDVISVAAPAGAYRWRVFSHRSSGDYTFFAIVR